MTTNHPPGHNENDDTPPPLFTPMTAPRTCTNERKLDNDVKKDIVPPAEDWLDAPVPDDVLGEIPADERARDSGLKTDVANAVDACNTDNTTPPHLSRPSAMDTLEQAQLTQDNSELWHDGLEIPYDTDQIPSSVNDVVSQQSVRDHATSSSSRFSSSEPTAHASQTEIPSGKSLFAKKTTVKASKKILLPFFIFAFLGAVGAQFIPALTEADAQQLPAFVVEYYDEGVRYLVYFFSVALILLGMRTLKQGKLLLYSDYIEYRVSMFKKIKIHALDIRSVHIHRSPFSFLGDIGTLEILGRNQQIEVRHIATPFTVQTRIEQEIMKK